VPCRESNRAIERVIAQQREDRRAALRGLVEELLRAVPARARHVHLVAAAEPWITIGSRLRTPSSIRSCLVGRVEPADTLFGRYEMLPPPARPVSSTSASSSARDASRLAIGAPVAVDLGRRVGRREAAAPAAIASRTARRIAAISSAVASRSSASAPITARRSVECPT
jgi:hypothetical protein